MTRVSAAGVKAFIISYLSKQLEASGRTLGADLSDDFDLLQEGAIDSLGMFNLTGELEQHFGQEIDFAGLDPEEMTTLGPLCRYIEKAIAQEGRP
jgi:acyl carrier protein